MDGEKALVHRPLCSSKAWKAAVAQEASVESPSSHGRSSNNKSLDTVGTISGAVPTKDGYTSIHTRDPVTLWNDNGVESSDKLNDGNRANVSSKLSIGNKKSSFDAELHRWKHRGACTAAQAYSVPLRATVIGSYVAYRRKMGDSAKTRLVPWVHRNKDKLLFRCDLPSMRLELFWLILWIAMEKRGT